jgi:hypothetical protein
MKIRSTFLLLALISWFAQLSFAAEPLEVSMVQLIANPKDYDGKVVRVVGFMKLEFEGNGIYLHRDDYKNNIFKNGLWIDTNEDIDKKAVELDQKYVLVQQPVELFRWCFE